MRLEGEADIEQLRAKALLLRTENERLSNKVVELLRENLSLKGVRFCYEKLLQDQPTLAGKLSVRWAIGPDGSVLGAAVVHDELGPAVAKCVVARVKRWEFPPPRGGGTVQVTFPWIFKRADE